MESPFRSLDVWLEVLKLRSVIRANNQKNHVFILLKVLFLWTRSKSTRGPTHIQNIQVFIEQCWSNSIKLWIHQNPSKAPCIHLLVGKTIWESSRKQTITNLQSIQVFIERQFYKIKNQLISTTFKDFGSSINNSFDRLSAILQKRKNRVVWLFDQGVFAGIQVGRIKTLNKTMSSLKEGFAKDGQLRLLVEARGGAKMDRVAYI